MVTREDVQRGLIESGFHDAGQPVDGGTSAVDVSAGRQPPPPVTYLFRRGHILVRDEYVDAVCGLLADHQLLPERAPDAGVAGPVVHGVRLVRLRQGGDDGGGVDGGDRVARALELVRDGVVRDDGSDRRRVAEGFGLDAAAPDYVVALSGWCNPREAQPVDRRLRFAPPPSAAAAVGTGVRVLILDNGFDPAARENPWLAGVTGDPDREILPQQDGTSVLLPYAGHGTFTAGVLRLVAPGATVVVRRAFPIAGAAYESDLVRFMDTALEQEHPDVVLLPAGTRAADSCGLLAFSAFVRNRLSLHKGVVIVTAAGNDGVHTHFWPAAGPGTVSVGSLSAELLNRSAWTNYGGWVDVYAQGDKLVNAFPSGRYTYVEPPDIGRVVTFTGLAEWGGTSFAAAVVAGRVAARMWATGENGENAAAALLAQARTAAVPGVGAVLLNH
jgi:hypothetical protein